LSVNAPFGALFIFGHFVGHRQINRNDPAVYAQVMPLTNATNQWCCSNHVRGEELVTTGGSCIFCTPVELVPWRVVREFGNWLDG
jgi:hypothetical protein